MKFFRETQFCRIKMDSFMVTFFQKKKDIEILINEETFEPYEYESPHRLCEDFFKGKEIRCKKVFSSVAYGEAIREYRIRYEKDKEGFVWVTFERT